MATKKKVTKKTARQTSSKVDVIEARLKPISIGTCQCGCKQAAPDTAAVLERVHHLNHLGFPEFTAGQMKEPNFGGIVAGAMIREAVAMAANAKVSKEIIVAWFGESMARHGVSLVIADAPALQVEDTPPINTVPPKGPSA